MYHIQRIMVDTSPAEPDTVTITVFRESGKHQYDVSKRSKVLRVIEWLSYEPNVHVHVSIGYCTFIHLWLRK